MAKKDVTAREMWPLGLPSLFEDSFWPQVWNVDQSGLSLSEDDKQVYVEAALPGLEAKDVKVDLANGLLTISGEREVEEKSDKRNYKRMQSSYSYQVSLPSNVMDGEDPKAELKNGILKIAFKKEPEKSTRRIEVKG